MTTPPTSLAPGDRLGRYQIVALLGAGGMGEVYRAHDPELHRDVALKVLRRSSASAEELARFSREARAAGGLNHPNIVVVYDVGVEAGVPYVVSELLEGETLRARLDRASVPFLKAVDYGSQIAEALGAAHARSIWHRDVKPANVFITNDGRVKLLDFGIAKLGEKQLRVGTNDPTEEVSDRHSIFGTAGYMAPEQVRGQPADHRSDIFAFGAVLYEMLTRMRAFKRDSTVQTMTAVLEDDPPDPLSIKPDLPPMAVAIVRRCLEKNKEERFQSARDLAFDLQQLRDASTKSRPLTVPVMVRRRKLGRAMAIAALVVAALVAGWWLASTPPPPVFTQLTFGRARISAARFVSDDRAAVYSEAREGNALDLWRHDLGSSPPTRPLDYPAGADILTSRAGEVTLLVNRRFLMGERFVGTLAEAPLGGGLPRELHENIEDADWDPNGEHMAVVRSLSVGGQSRIEYPIGTPLHETLGSIRFPRVSPDRRFIAFIEDPVGGGEGGHVTVIDVRSGTVTKLTADLNTARGLAWSPDGKEIWFAAGTSRSTRQLLAVTLSKDQRVVMSAPGSLTLWDIDRDGRVLVSRDEERRSLVGMAPGDSIERDLSWYDDSGLADVSNDGTRLLFSDRFGVWLRNVHDSLPKRVGTTETFADALSPDGSKILATTRAGDQLLILSTGAGAEQKLPAHGIIKYSGSRWFPDGERILISGNENKRGLRAYVQDLKGGPPTPITPEGIWALTVSPDSQWAAVIGNVPGVSLWPITGDGQPRALKGSEKGDRPVAFTTDGQALWMFRRGEVPSQVIKLNIVTGERQIARTLRPTDVAGVNSITEFAITPDGRAYFYSYSRLLSQLYLVTGLR